MSLRKACTRSRKALRCPYGDHRCACTWESAFMIKGQRYGPYAVDDYASVRKGPAHVITKKDGRDWENRMRQDVKDGRDPRRPPDQPTDRASIPDALADYQQWALEHLAVHPPVISEVKHIREFFRRRALTDLETLSAVNEFIAELREGWRPPDQHGEPQEPLEDGRGEVAVNRILQRLRNFTGWCMAQKVPLLKATPFHRFGIVIRTSKENQRTRRLQDGEEANLLAACKAIDDLDHRFAGRIIERRILGARYLGGRGSELDRVRVSDIDWKKWTVVLRKGKSEERELSIGHKRLRDVLLPRRFLKPPHDFVFGDHDGAIVNENGTKISHRSAFETVVLVAHGRITSDGVGRHADADAQALVEIDLHFHDLRRECASQWYRETGGDLWRVSQWLGHSSIEMTRRYLALPKDTRQAADMATKLRHRKARRA